MRKRDYYITPPMNRRWRRIPCRVFIALMVVCAALITVINISVSRLPHVEPEPVHTPMPTVTPQIIIVAPEPVPEAEEPETESLGTFRITVYTPYCDGGKWGYQTATGATSEHLATCAVDPELISLGSVIHIGGLELRAIDTGSAVKGNVIDIFYDGTQDEARRWIQEFGTNHEVEVWEG